MDKYNLIIQAAQNIISPGSRATISPIVSETVNELLAEKYGNDWKNGKDVFLNAYAELRSKFELTTYKNDIPYFYALYYLSLNIPKLQIVLLELLKKTIIKKDLKILDIGSGVGTSLLSFIDLSLILESLSSLFEIPRIFNNLSFTMVEGSKENIEVFKKVFSIYKNKTVNYFDYKKRLNLVGPIISDIGKKFTPYVKNSIEGQKFDLIILSNIVNEIQPEKRIELLQKIIQYLSDDGYLIIIEPADSGKSRQLNSLKYQIINCSKLIKMGICLTQVPPIYSNWFKLCFSSINKIFICCWSNKYRIFQ
jgi:SAM-dependent methyltransferase